MAKKEERYEELAEMEEIDGRDEMEEKKDRDEALLKFGENLQKKRKEKFRTQEDFAERLSMSSSTYSQYEQGKRWPKSPKALTRMAALLDTSIDYLLNGREAATDTYMEYVRGFIRDNIRPNEILERNMSQGEDCKIKTPYGRMVIPYTNYENLMQEVDFNFRSAIKERIDKEINDQRAKLEGTAGAITHEIQMICEHLNYDIELIIKYAKWLFKDVSFRSGDLAYIIYSFYFMKLSPSDDVEALYKEYVWRREQAQADIYCYDMEENYYLGLETGKTGGELHEIGLPPSGWNGYFLFNNDDSSSKIDEFIKSGLHAYWKLPNAEREWLEKSSNPYANYQKLFFYHGLSPITSLDLPLKNIMSGYLLSD